MQTDGTVSAAERGMARQIWLNYYNNYLRDHGVITEQAWRKMRLTIDQSKPSQANARQQAARSALDEAGQELQNKAMTMG